MNIHFSKTEAKAIISLVIDIAQSDNKIHPNEAMLVEKLCDKFSLSQADLIAAKSLQPDDVVGIISAMPWDKRKLVSYILYVAAGIDGYVHENESANYYFISNYCGLVTSEMSFDTAMATVNDFLKS